MPRPLTDEEVTLAQQLYPHTGWTTPLASLTEQGSSYRVAILQDHVAIRIGRAQHHKHSLARLSSLLPQLAEQLPFQIPLPLSEVTPTPLGAAMAFSYVPGQVHPHISASQRQNPVQELARLMDALLNVKVTELEKFLAPPYSYRGPWDAPKISRTYNFFTLNAPELAPLAQQLLATIEAYPAGFATTAGLVHADLAGENMRWDTSLNTITGLLDWDLAAIWDPAINLSHLSLWHGPAIIEPVVAQLIQQGQLGAMENFAARTRYFSAVLALENISDAATRDLQPKPMARLLRKVAPRLEYGVAGLERLK